MEDDNLLDDLGRSATNFGRAAVGQGALMGWGDEAEAWLRSKLGQEPYPEQLAKVRQDYGQYAAQNPWTAGLAEFAGGVLPAAATLLVPGGQAGTPIAAGRLYGALSKAGQMISGQGLGTLGKGVSTVGVGAAQGAISGAGAAEEGQRLDGATSGAVLGGGLGAAVPLGVGATKGAYDWLAERLAPSADRIQSAALSKINRALGESNLQPEDVSDIMMQDRGLGVPSVVANASNSLSDLTESVAQRVGPGTRNIEDTLAAQKLGARERTHLQVQKGLNPGKYYEDLENLKAGMKAKAGPAYRQAYAYGEVTDPAVLDYLKLPQFQKAFGKAQELAEAEGRVVDFSKPTVETLDNLKQGLDRMIEGETDSVTGKVTKLGAAYINKKNEFLDALDNAVPDYKAARAIYRGDAELMDALRSGHDEFGRLDHEQLIKKIGGMSDAEKQAYRTGVARKLYGDIMKPTNNQNAAQRVIGAPESQAKLQALFDDPAQFNLFKAAMTREAQLYNQASRILGGSQTAKRQQMGRVLDQGEGDGLGEAVLGGAVTGGGLMGALPGMVLRMIQSGGMTDKVANKMAKMLMSKDPAEVAAVVKALEEHAAKQGPKEAVGSAVNRGITGGITSSIYSPPQIGLNIGPGLPENIEDYEPSSDEPVYDIEADIAADEAGQGR